jgi:uncharacterized protein
MFWPIVTFVVIAQSLLFLLHFFVYATLVKAFYLHSQSTALVLKIVLLAFSLTFFAASLLVNKWSNSFLDAFYFFASVWVGTLYFLFSASVIFWAIYFFAKLLNLQIQTQPLGAVLFALAIILSAYSVFHAQNTQVKQYTSEIPNLPQNWKGKKIALVTDVHLGNIHKVNFAQKLVKIINGQNPEIVLIAGDYFDGPPANYNLLAQPLTKINAPSGVYFSTGNHEEFRDNKPYLDALANSGVNNLVDDFADVNGLQIIGVDYENSGRNRLGEVLGKITYNKNKPSILMMHAPTQQQAALDSGINLMVSGHTHKGQIWPAEWITHSMYKGFDYGIHNFGKLINITSSGAGSWGPPQRFLTNSEIVIITLK